MAGSAKRSNATAPVKAPVASVPSDVNDQVIALRSEGRGFATIAKTLGLGRSSKAFGAFVDGVATRSRAEQAKLRAEENSRLDALEKRTRTRSEAPELDRKLAVIARLRQRLGTS